MINLVSHGFSIHGFSWILFRFYSHNSSFVHGGLDNGKEAEAVYGQQDIHQKIMQLNFRDCHAKIRQVDSHETLANGVVVQVSGELSNNGEPMRRFMQTFVLAPQSPKKYYVHNDIFRYQDEVFNDGEDTLGANTSTEDQIGEMKEIAQEAITAPIKQVIEPKVSLNVVNWKYIEREEKQVKKLKYVHIYKNKT